MQFNLYFKRTSLLSATYSLLLAFFFSSCEKEPTKKNQLPDAKTQKVWILNEGLFNFGNASLDVYVPDSQQIFNDVYKTANAKSLGDVGQSISFNGSFAYVVVNNSGKIVVLDKKTFLEVGAINIPNSSPRFLHFVKDDLAYVTELYAKRIWLINPATKTLLDTISTTGWTEQIAANGNELFIAQRTRLNDAYVANVLVVNTSTKKIVNTITLPTEPNSLVLSGNALYVLCSADAALSKNASLVKINTTTKSIDATMEFASGKSPGLLRLDAKNNRLLWRDGDVYQMPFNSSVAAATVFIAGSARNIYTMDIDPANADVYISDAHDYVQASTVYRYSFNGDSLQKFKAGVITSAFGFE
jgi:DNA-binding beta-propeller fold protein YncE